MTRDKDRKRIIRIRMHATGESYTTARGHVLARAVQKSGPRATAATTKPPQVDHAAIAGMADEKIKQQTGHDWREWIRLLDAERAASMTHGAIARLVHDKYGVPGWWSQTVTVGYERLIGRREKGQRSDGAYEVSKSKTFNVPVHVLFEACADSATRRRWLDGVDAAIRTATAPKSMRLQWPDGTIVVLWFTPKGAAKSTIALAHSKLASREALDNAKAEWTTRLEALTHLLDERL